MSVLSIESFIAFEAVNSIDDTSTTANNNMRAAVAANLRRAGYQVAIPATNAAGFVVRPDPVNPDRNALYVSSGTFTANTVCAAIRKKLPNVNDAIIGGFSLYVPPEYVAGTTAKAVNVLRVIATPLSDAAWDSVTAVATNEVFRITSDLLVKWFTDAAQSSKAITPGRINYVEYRISDNDVRVWIDDTLVMQKATALNTETIGFIFEQQTATAPNTNLNGAAGRWVIGNWYNLGEDALAPNVRLGPSTRIIGKRPGGDVSVQFGRPVGYASNAAVVAQNLVDSPVDTLQSMNVGDQDVYSATDGTTNNARLVHAVVTKVLAANLESNSHTIRPIIRSKDGVEISTPKSREWRAHGNAISGRDIKGVARRPTDGKIFAVGSANSIYSNSQHAAPGTPWTTISDDGGAVINNGIVFRADGYGVIARSDGKVGVLTPGSDVPVVVTPATNANALNHVAVLPNGRFIAVGVSGAICMTNAGAAPELSASWTRVAPLAQPMVASAFAPTLGAQGRLVVMSSLSVSGTTNIYVTSDDGGATWVARSGSPFQASNNYRSLTWDGNAFVAHSQTQNGSRRSTDGISWAPLANYVWGGSANFGFVDPDSSLQISPCNSGCVYISRDANNFHYLQVNTTQTLNGACKAANGDFVVVGNAGTLVTYTAADVDSVLSSLGGYVPTFNAAPLDSTTGAPWQPSDAALSQFGMRLTS